MNDEVYCYYTNWKGKTELRKVRPIEVWFGSTQYHEEPQWLLRAFDVEGKLKDFALRDFCFDVHRYTPKGNGISW